MIGWRIDEAKSRFFDRAAVMADMDPKTRRVFSRFGSFVRRTARSSIKKAPQADPGTGLILKGRKGKRASVDATSQPGNPPYGHGPQLLKKGIVFAWDGGTKSVVIGPTKIGGVIGNAPEALEHGGVSQMLLRQRKGTRLVPIDVEARPFMQPALEAELPKLDGMWKQEDKR